MNASSLPCGVSSSKSRHIFTAWSCVYFLFLPVFLAILAVGYRNRKNLSDSDIFTFHMVAMEMVCVAGCALGCYGFYAGHAALASAAEHLVVMTGVGQVCFHSLTCVERYLAVVWPVTYLRLRRGGGVRVRNVAVGVAWLLSVGQIVVIAASGSEVPDLVFGCVFAVVPFALVSFCSVAVLRALIRPGPGEKGGARRSVDQTKWAAFCTMMAVLAVLSLRLVAFVVYHGIFLVLWYSVDHCVMSASSLWFTLPSSLVLPLLFLHRDATRHR